MRIKILLFFLLCWPTLLVGVGGSDETEKEDSDVLFTGTLLAYSGFCVTPDQLFVQPTFIMAQSSREYNAHGDLEPIPNTHLYPWFITVQKGIVKNVDAQVTFQGSYNVLEHAHQNLLGDTLFLLGFQLFEEDKKKSRPFNLRLLLGESFPTGKFNNLNPELFGIDISSTGSFQTIVIFATEKLLYKKSRHPLNVTSNLIFVFPSPVSVSGLSPYGGGPGTRGRVIVGKEIIADLALEYSLSKHWALALDVNYIHQAPSHFDRSRGSTGPDATRPAAFIASMTPGIEYSINEKIGMLAGAWFSVTGANISAFRNAYFSFYYYF